MSGKIKVGVLMGGPSSEREVSLDSGKNVFTALDPEKFQGTPLILDENLNLSSEEKRLKFPDDLGSFDIIFNALHGEFGEDGQIQYILEKLKVPYTGSGIEASSLGMDKWASYEVFRKEGLEVPKEELLAGEFENNLQRDFPLVVKPRNGGSSLGVFIVKDRMDLARRIENALEFDDELVIQEYIQGREFTCPVLEAGGKIKALPVIEIKPKSEYEFFNYEAKYKTGASDEIVPAKITQDLALKIQKASVLAHKILRCRVYSRSDFILDGKELYILELNTLPGLTRNSLVPKAALAAGILFPELIEIIIENSFKYFRG